MAPSPNAELSTARIEIFAPLDRIRLFAILQFGYDTTPEQVREIDDTLPYPPPGPPRSGPGQHHFNPTEARRASMTFSLIGRCDRTNMFGMAIATRPMAIGAKCPFVRPVIGGLLVQANGDPRLGPLGLKLLEMGYSARKVLAELEASDGPDNIEWRQIAVIDKDGNTAARTGISNEDWKGHVAKRDVCALGNRLTGEATVTRMIAAFEASGGEALAERLVRALEAGRDAGGQIAGQHSAALLVYHRKSYAWVDLRVDEHDEPVGELRRLWELYIPLIDYYDRRPANPSMPRDDDWRKGEGIRGGPR